MEINRGFNSTRLNVAKSPHTESLGRYDAGRWGGQSAVQPAALNSIVQLAGKHSSQINDVNGVKGSQGSSGVAGSEGKESDKIQQKVERKIANAYREEKDRLNRMTTNEFVDEFKEYGLNMKGMEASVYKQYLTLEMRDKALNIFVNDDAFGTKNFVKSEVLRLAGYVSSKAGVFGAFDNVMGAFGLADGYLGETPYAISYNCDSSFCNHEVFLK